jgi:hypothetical protein
MTEAQLAAPPMDESSFLDADDYVPAVNYTLARLMDMQRRIIARLRRELEDERRRSETYRRLIADFDRQRSAPA